MSIVPISDKAPACYGICCSRRRECARYEAVDSTLMDHTIATCCDGAGERPLFIERKPVEA
jgi:hypothetical protein